MTSTRSGSAVLIRTVAASVLLVVDISCVCKTRLNGLVQLYFAWLLYER